MRTGSDGKPLFGVEDWHENFPVCCWFDNGCHEHSAVRADATFCYPVSLDVRYKFSEVTVFD